MDERSQDAIISVSRLGRDDAMRRLLWLVCRKRHDGPGENASHHWLLWLAVAESAISVASSREVSGPHYGRIGALTAAGATMIG